MSDIKPIPTLYRGVQFKSRLEARWAHVLHTLRMKHGYEQRRYRVSDATGATVEYLPDFITPCTAGGQYLWEIKHEKIDARAILTAATKLLLAVEQHREYAGILIIGPPHHKTQAWLLKPSGIGQFSAFALIAAIRSLTDADILCAFDDAASLRFDEGVLALAGGLERR